MGYKVKNENPAWLRDSLGEFSSSSWSVKASSKEELFPDLRGYWEENIFHATERLVADSPKVESQGWRQLPTIISCSHWESTNQKFLVEE